MSEWLTWEGMPPIRKSEVATLGVQDLGSELFTVWIILKSGKEITWGYLATDSECNELYNYLLKELEIEEPDTENDKTLDKICDEVCDEVLKDMGLE